MSNRDEQKGMPSAQAGGAEDGMAKADAHAKRASAEAKAAEDLAKEARSKVKGIAVIAKSEAYFNKRRIKPGVQFTIESMDQLGSWMQLADPKLEAERQKKEVEKKKGAK